MQYGASRYVWAPVGDTPPRPKSNPPTRRALGLYRCEHCGYVELYAPEPEL
jgi:hypothetical protein